MRILIAFAAVAALAVVGAVVDMDTVVAQAPGTGAGGCLVVVPASDLNPYQESRTFLWGSNECGFTAQACEVFYSPVPAGKRLIVENVSGHIVINAGSAVRTVQLTGAGSSNFYVPAVLQSVFLSASTFAVNSEVLAHFEPGQVPRIFINTDSVNGAFSGNELTISGHFVQLP